MTKLEYIQHRLEDARFRKDLAIVVEDVDALVPGSEEEFGQVASMFKGSKRKVGI